MDINFQDRIDEYLLHPDRLSEEEKSQFLSELEADPKKRAQFELTRDVRLAVTSRARKMSRMEEMRTMYGHVRSHVAMNCLNAAEDRQDAPRRKRWVWLSGIAAAVVLGFFVARLVPGSSSSAHVMNLQQKAKVPKKTMKAMDKADRENTIVDMYVNGHSFEDIMAVSGYSSRSSVFSVLHRHGVKLNRGKFSGPLGTRKKKKDDSPAEE